MKMMEDFIQFFQDRCEVESQIWTYAKDYSNLTNYKHFDKLEHIDFDECTKVVWGYGGDKIDGILGGIYLHGSEYLQNWGEEHYSLEVPIPFIFGDDNYRAQFIQEYHKEQERLQLRAQQIKEEKELQARQIKERSEKELYNQLRKKYGDT